MKHRILIVEDNILLAGQQKKWFEKSGYEAVTTIDEPGARRLLKKEPFDLVLSDVRLPQGDGISLLEWMQRERIDVPFIIMTGYASVSDAVRAIKMGAKAETLSGLTGIGDLIVTCESRHSRNRKAGMLIGQGYTMKQAMDEVKMVVEGVYSAKAAIALAKKYGVDMPIIEEVNCVLFEDKPAKEAVRELMMRDRRAEHSALEWEA